MEKGEKLLFKKVLLIAFVLFFVNAGWFVYEYGGENGSGLSGFSVKTIGRTVFNLSEMPKLSQIFLIAQWGLIFLVMVYTLAKDKITINKRKEISSFKVNSSSTKNKTDLDALYEVLKKNKKLRISSIAKAFRVSDDTASEWCKILESGDLAEIDYPGFGVPVIKLKGKKVNTEEIEEESNKTDLKKEKKSFFKRMFSKKEKSLEDKEVKKIRKKDLLPTKKSPKVKLKEKSKKNSKK